MIRLAKLTDYGIVLLTRFAQAPLDRPLHAARDLSSETGLPLPTVSKLLKALSKAGLLVSHRGIHGGYSLARRPAEISVAEIIVAIEGPIALTECSGALPSACELESRCPTRAPWRKISQAVLGALEGLTLADMTQPALPVRTVSAPGTSLPNLSATTAAASTAGATFPASAAKESP